MRTLTETDLARVPPNVRIGTFLNRWRREQQRIAALRKADELRIEAIAFELEPMPDGGE